ncbi:MAG: trypsin-like peptidase domain-containing protein [Proteobacteria bacterium]|nr:trypsin-like peptidase domain-containing protein [Pseudomonadota bacterium]
MKHTILAAVLMIALSSPSGADFQAGLEAYNQGDYAAALGEWKPLAEAGDAAAQFNLGRLYEEGRGVPRDGVRAFLWYRKAALKGSKPAAKAVARFQRDRPEVIGKARKAEARIRVEERQQAELRRLKEEHLKARKRAERPPRRKRRRSRVAAKKAKEALSVPIPPGWTLGSAQQISGAGTGIIETLLKIKPERKLYLPAGETPETWSEVIGVEAFPKPAPLIPDRIHRGWLGKVISGCETGHGADPKSRQEQGFLTVRATYACAKLKLENRGSFRVLKVIEGRKAVYVISRTWRGKTFPAAELSNVAARFDDWMFWFDRVGAGGPKSAAERGKYSRGNGFMVSRQGHILTNHHVVKGCRKLRIASSAAKLLASNPINHLAIIKVRRKPLSVAAFRDGGKIAPGEPVVVAGAARQGRQAELSVSTGVVGAPVGGGVGRQFMAVTAPVQPGNSGGPLVDLAGNVVGVVMAKPDALKWTRSTGDISKNINFALDGKVARDFLDAQGVPYGTAPSNDILSPADAGGKARTFTVSVECWK